jgi:hypothetical protein
MESNRIAIKTAKITENLKNAEIGKRAVVMVKKTIPIIRKILLFPFESLNAPMSIVVSVETTAVIDTNNET